MTSLDSPAPSSSGIRIDTRFLLRQIPSLVQIKRGHRHWNDYGEKLVRELQVPAPTVRTMARMPGLGETSQWALAKQLIYNVLATGQPEYQSIRKRLGNLQTVPTPILLSTLGLWLAGALGMSVSVTNPIVAAILFAVAEAAGDWEILNGLSRPNLN